MCAVLKRAHRVHSGKMYNVTFRNIFYTAPPPLQHARRVRTGMKAALGLKDSQITSDLTSHTSWLLEVSVSEVQKRQPEPTLAVGGKLARINKRMSRPPSEVLAASLSAMMQSEKNEGGAKLLSRRERYKRLAMPTINTRI